MCRQIVKYIPQAAGIVYLIDGTEYNVSSIAEYWWFPILFSRNLYDLFVSPAFVAHPCPLLLAVNKSDLPACADNQVVFEKLENELLLFAFIFHS